jgi:hypothetical protein
MLLGTESKYTTAMEKPQHSGIGPQLVDTVHERRGYEVVHSIALSKRLFTISHGIDMAGLSLRE